MSKRLIVIALVAGLIAISLVLAARFRSSDLEQAARQPLTVQLQWEPSAQFLGFYVARQRGFYADESLDVRFLHGGPNVDPISNVIQRNAGVGLATADQVLRWNDARPDDSLAAVGTVFSRSLAVFMVHADSGLQTPADFAGHRVGVFPSYDTESLLWLLLGKASLDRNAVTQINFPSFANFERRDVDAYGAYIINEPVLARLRGLKIAIIDPVDYDIRFYSDTLIARRDYLSGHRPTVEAFVRASIKGWQSAEADPQAALADMRREVGGVFGPGEPWSHQEGVASEALKYLRNEEGRLFEMDRSIWSGMEASLRSLGILKRQGLVEETCDFSLARRVNDDGAP